MTATVTRCQAKVKIACGVLLASKLRRTAQYQNCPQNLGTVLRQLHGPKGASKMLRATGHGRMVRGRAKLSARFGACQCYYMFFTIQPKIAIFMAQFKYLINGQNA